MMDNILLKMSKEKGMPYHLFIKECLKNVSAFMMYDIDRKGGVCEITIELNDGRKFVIKGSFE